MKLVLINDGYNPKCEEYLIQAAKKRKLQVQVLNPQENYFDLEKPLERVLLYRISLTAEAEAIQNIYLVNGAISFRKDRFFSAQRSKLKLYSILTKNKIPIPKTIFSQSKDEKTLKQIVKKLGLPIILKTIDGTRGNGVILVDSFFGLKSLVEVLHGKRIPFLYQELIPEATGKSIRAIVIEDEIICAYEKRVSNKIDFRSNAFSNRKIVKLDKKTQAIVLGATRAIRSSFGGVDLLYTKKGYTVTEVNFPCNFATSQDFTGIDIAGKMVDFLIAKAKRMQ